VSYRIGDMSIRLPLSHDLPHFQHVFPNYSRNLGRLAALAHTARPDLAAVDVGANVGDSVAIIRAETHVPVLAIEGDPRFFALLEQNAPALGPDLYLRCVMVGATPGQRQGAMEARGGSAHFVEAEAQGAVVRFDTLARLIDGTPELAGRKLLVKVDTDGLDEMILKAEKDLLRARAPIVFFEYDPHHFQRYGDDGFAVFATLRDAGYSDLVVYENTGEMRGGIRLEDEAALNVMDASYRGRGGERYADIAAFHAGDRDVYALVLASR
jgi:FkbM family methyltransferase